jgi:hypothetical protein
MSIPETLPALPAAASGPPAAPLDGSQAEGAAEHLADASAEAAPEHLPSASAEAAAEHLPNASAEAASEHLADASVEAGPEHLANDFGGSSLRTPPRHSSGSFALSRRAKFGIVRVRRWRRSAGGSTGFGIFR